MRRTSWTRLDSWLLIVCHLMKCPRMPAFVVGVRPALAVKRRRPEIVIEEIGDDIVGKELHPAIRVVNDEPFARAK
jgi:hypothetical protein